MSRTNLACVLWTTVAIGLGCLSSVSACTIVQNIKYRECSGNCQFLATSNGKPIDGVKIWIYTPDLRPVQSLTTDNQGLVRPTTLPPGRYHVYAMGHGELRTDLYLEVSVQSVDDPAPIIIDLNVKPQEEPPLAQELAIAEKAKIRDRMPAFKGVLTDIKGAVIANAEISIFPKGTYDRAHALRTKSDLEGRFESKLKVGTYTVVFHNSGFEDKFLSFEITRGGNENRLNVEMKVALNVATCG
jgi:hypothetical protein